MESINNHKYLIAVILSAIVFLAFILLISFFNFGNPDNISIIAIMLNSLFGFLYAVLVKNPTWYLGIFTSFVFWVYLSLVSISLFFYQQPEWWPLGEAMVILVTACLAVLLGKSAKTLLFSFFKFGS